jgi:hypothetical protein
MPFPDRKRIAMISVTEKNIFANPALSRLGSGVLVLSVLLAGTVFPRLIMLGAFPRSDDGYYAFVAQWIHHGLVNGQGIPDSGMLSLYPLLFPWVFSFDYNPLILLRFVDLCVATLAAFMLYKVLKNESGNRVGAALITLVFTFTLNQELFIDHGFKNSIMPGFVFLFSAMYIAQNIMRHEHAATHGSWWMVGALTALSVIVRETFIPFAVLGLVAVFIAQGRKAALRFFLGGIVTGMVVIGGILLARGGMAGILSAYRDAGIVFGFMNRDSLWDHFMPASIWMVANSLFAVFLSILAILALALIVVLRRNRRLALRLLFWLSFVGLALIEPATKISFPYHFALMLPGLAGLCALALREVTREGSNQGWANRERKDAVALLGVMLSAIWFSFGSTDARIHWVPITLETIMASGGEWSEEFVGMSNYLVILEEVKKAMPEDGTLSVSGNMNALHPLTGHLPPSFRLVNLSAVSVLQDFSVVRIREVLMNCAPDVIMLDTHNNFESDNPNLLAAIVDTGLYETVARIPVSSVRHYGKYGGIVFRKTRPTDCLVPY